MLSYTITARLLAEKPAPGFLRSRCLNSRNTNMGGCWAGSWANTGFAPVRARPVQQLQPSHGIFRCRRGAFMLAVPEEAVTAWGPAPVQLKITCEGSIRR